MTENKLGEVGRLKVDEHVTSARKDFELCASTRTCNAVADRPRAVHWNQGIFCAVNE